MNLSSLLERDLRNVSVYFPKLMPIIGPKGNYVELNGELDICDSQGNYCDSFEIKILSSESYPYEVPTLIEVGHRIKRDNQRHISDDGICCVDMEHRLLWEAKRGILLYDFIRLKAYPFFANQLYYERTGRYANGEWDHQFSGIMEFYEEGLHIEGISLAIKVLNTILNGKIPGRNEVCICGKSKFKNCHYNSVVFLKALNRVQLLKDLAGFMAANSRNTENQVK